MNLSFVSGTNFPAASGSASSNFFVWVSLSSNINENLKDLPVTIGTDGLTILSNQDSNTNKIKTYQIFNGTRDFWWQSDSGLASTKNITVFVGNSGDQLLVNRTVSIV